MACALLASQDLGGSVLPQMGVSAVIVRVFALAATSLTIAGCSIVPKKEQAGHFPDLIDAVARDADEKPSLPPPNTGNGQKPPADRLVYYRGVKGSLASEADADSLAGKTISFQFVNAPAADVARAVISEVLGETVSIASGVSGSITLSSPEPIPASEALSALETVLSESRLALLRSADGYLLTTLDAANNDTVGLNRPGSTIGYGVAFAPIRYASPSDVANLVTPLVSSRLTVTPDETRSAIILKGPQTDIAAAMDAIETFDTPQLTDRTFGMFRLRYADAATLKTEIDQVMDAASVGAGAPVELIALPRLNLVFVSARTKQAFDEVRGWIDRFDEPSGGDERRLRYYSVLNTSADALAEQLNAAFGGPGFQDPLGAPGGAGQTVPAAASAVQPRFQNYSASPGLSQNLASVSVDATNNALIIRATDQEYREIVDLVERMDVLAPQVLIEATIAEVTLNDSLGFGVRWFLQNAESTATLSDDARGSLGSVFPGFNYTFVDTDARVALNTLASVTDVSVLSAPSIMVLNNQAAHLQVGDEVPIVTQQAQSTTDGNAPIVSTLQLRETGVILDVKPRINASDVVTLEITQEVSDVAPTTTSGIDSPTIQQRKFTSTVAVRDNGTIALGGLIRETYTDNESGIPLLKDIPAIGYAFKSRDITKRRTELVIFLTPRIIRTDDDARNSIKYIRREMSRLGKTKS